MFDGQDWLSFRLKTLQQHTNVELQGQTSEIHNALHAPLQY